jgi:hypothetical protein
MREVGKNGHQSLWIEAIDAKFEKTGRKLDRQFFDQIMSDFEVDIASTLPSRTLHH